MTAPSPIGRLPRGRPQRQLARSSTIPAPVGGINTVDAATAMPVGDAFTLVNMVGGSRGLVSRMGFSEWCIGMSSNPVRSVIPFAGSTSAKDRLFACTSAAIFDCTTSSQTPSSVHTFGTSDGNSGFGSFTTFVTSAGHFGIYCDESNGFLLYTESTDAWTAGSVTGVTAANLAFAMSWKNRLFFVEKATAKAWYLSVGTISGTVTRIDFGNRFPHGGTLVGLYSMTIDGGTGIDDYLVAISSAGDVLVYQGTDPATAGAFECVGMYSVGAVPAGRRIASELGGDLLIASLAGAVPLSKLRTGTIGPNLYTTQKIQSLFNTYARDRKTNAGWHIQMSPEENCLLVNMPTSGSVYEQFAMSLSTGGWSLFQDRPSLSSAVWKGSLYFGTADGRLCKVTGDLDDVKLSGAATYDEVDWSGVTSFQSLGSLRRKQIQEIRPRMLTDGAAAGYSVEARYDFDTSEIATAPTDPTTEGVATWDSAIWDTSVWPAVDSPFGSRRGATGSGTHMAVAFRGRSNAKTTIMGWDVTWTEGGLF